MRHSARPTWVDALAAAATDVDPADLGRLSPPRDGGRASAVLMLFYPDAAGGDSVVLTQRSSRLRAHAGQVSFPGGRIDPQDDGPVAAALREAHEEVGLAAAGVDVFGTLPPVYVPVSNSVVTAVLGWSALEPALSVRSPQEVESVRRVPLDRLLDPGVRFVATHPNGYRGPAFELDDLYIWGFTAALLSGAFDLAGLTRAWDSTRTRPLPQRYGRPVTSDDITRQVDSS
ncbi:8-oxo-dGTP pyrophosphatase MutT (NUDIX family) [Kineosphaera limosa]|uniref:Putative hydrolase n=1 Tax=Kineosphaera limosa NBRC 100340 TaxID=1184609 RepID=K6XEM7_9MICO|nr:CoA pyrophosphatase [Kineosphaera limosa]NYE00176.1 8-oxo-dGTP pyrophosphatase MutT (NUDIX family) [Kineosphaera limosa]GAB97274.1 putative hydrolase [Kineosphaera limosa NBRC 100340]